MRSTVHVIAAAVFGLILPHAQVQAGWTDVPFIRGDINGDGGVDLSDATGILEYLFGDGYLNEDCLGAADVNTDRAIDVSDAIYLFGGSGPAGVAFDEILKVDIDPATMDITGYGKVTVSLPESLYGAGCAYNDADGRIYIFGGAREDGTAADAAYAFTPESQGGPSIDAARWPSASRRPVRL